MTDEERQAAVNEALEQAHAAIDRVNALPRRDDTEEILRARRLREPPPDDPPTRYSEPLVTRAEPAIVTGSESEPVTEPVIMEYEIMGAIDEVQNTIDAMHRKIATMQAEIDLLKADHSLGDLRQDMRNVVGRMDEFLGRLRETSTVIDMPSPLPRRDRSGMN